MQITVEGVRSEQRLRYRYDLVDRYDAASGTSSMARATGYAATMTVRLVANGMYSRKGLSAPSTWQASWCVEFLLKGLGDRGLIYRRRWRSCPEPRAFADLLRSAVRVWEAEGRGTTARSLNRQRHEPGIRLTFLGWCARLQ